MPGSFKSPGAPRFNTNANREATDYDKFVFECIVKEGKPPGRATAKRTNSLTWLRRNGYIRNIGSRSHPKWEVIPHLQGKSKAFLFNRFLHHN